jgi:hypothetical protein
MLPSCFEKIRRKRDYQAALLFYGSDFAPGVTIGFRAGGDEDEVHWSPPSLSSGDYLELATGVNPARAPLYYVPYEFCAKNPTGGRSEWVSFSPPFSDPYIVGMELVMKKDFASALEPLGRAKRQAVYVSGAGSHDDLLVTGMLELALAKTRFRTGDSVNLVEPSNVGGPIFVRVLSGELVRATNEQVLADNDAVVVEDADEP